MTTQPSSVDLIAGYSAYTTADELTLQATVEAPAFTPVWLGQAPSSCVCLSCDPRYKGPMEVSEWVYLHKHGLTPSGQ